MPRVCTICTHDERRAIDLALVGEGANLREISALFRVSEDAIARHRDKHLPTALTKAQEAQEAAQADDLLAQVRDLQERTLMILAKAEQTGALGQALGAIREARGNLELLARLEGKIREQQTVNILVAPQWLTLRATITQALAPYPDARAAVAAALLQVET